MKMRAMLGELCVASFQQPHHEKAHVKISKTAKCQSCRLKTCEMADI